MYEPKAYYIQWYHKEVHNLDIDAVQHSSGCLFSTFVGQGAWFRNICDIEDQKFPREQIDSHYLFVSRELDAEARRPGEYMAWTSEPTVITSDMHRGYVVSDGWDETHFTRGSTITIDIQGPDLQLLTFRSTMLDRVANWLDN